MDINSSVKYLGVTDETTTCDCCGKGELKSVIGLELASGAVVRYGTTCAAKALGLRRSPKTFAAVVAKIEEIVAGNAAKAKAVEAATEIAAMLGCVVYVTRKNGEFNAVREAAYNARGPVFYGYPVATVGA
jgi:hypothetical protein